MTSAGVASLAATCEDNNADAAARFSAAQQIRDWAQSYMDEQREHYAEVLRKRREDGLAAEKELARLGAIGRPVKARRTRKRKTADTSEVSV